MGRVDWWSFDFKTGVRNQVLAVDQPGRVERFINEATSTSIGVRFVDEEGEIPGVEEATQEGRALLVAVDSDDDRILWGGLLIQRDDTPAAVVSCQLATVESYFFRRFIDGNVSWNLADVSTIAADAVGLITDLPPLQVVATATGTLLSGAYTTYDEKAIGDLLSELANVANGIEWTVELVWADLDHTALKYQVMIAPRLGGKTSPTSWTMPGAVTSFRRTRSYGTENGANDVTASSSGEGSSKPTSQRIVDNVALNAGWARFQRRFRPAPSITSTATLDKYAEAEFERTRFGLTTLSIEARLSEAPQMNSDWWLGDNITVDLTCARFPERVVDGMAVPGYSHSLRIVGWVADFDNDALIPHTREIEEST